MINNIQNLLLESEFYMDDLILTSLEEGIKNKLKLGAVGVAIAGGLSSVGKKTYDNIKNNQMVGKYHSANLDLKQAQDYADNVYKDSGKFARAKRTTNINGEDKELLLNHPGRVFNADRNLDSAKEKVVELQNKNPNIDNLKYSEPKIGDVAPGLAIAGIAGAYLIYKFFKSLTYTNHKIKQLEIKVKEYPELKPKLEKLYKNKEEIQKKMRVENNNFIEKSKLMKAKLTELERSKSPDKEEIASLKIKLEKRMKFINKIGAKI
jgi:hypothetical protein